MRKLKLQVQISIDGFISGINGEMDWLTLAWSADLKEYVRRLTEPVDLILLGKNLAQGFIPYWTEELKSANPEEGAEKFVNTPKIVFTKSLIKSGWDNTELATGDLTEEINVLKKKEGGDIIVYGGAKLVSSLIKNNLIDELHLFVNPVSIGEGLPIFQSIDRNQHYKLLRSENFDCGINVLVYKPC